MKKMGVKMIGQCLPKKDDEKEEEDDEGRENGKRSGNELM